VGHAFRVFSIPLNDCASDRDRVVMRAFRCVAALIAIMLTAVGCSQSSLSPSSPSTADGSRAITSDQLSGTWNLVSLEPSGDTEQAAPAGATYSLTFAAGRLSTRADCNTCGGTFALSGQTLTAGPALACTRAACPTMAFENRYTTVLSGDSTLTLTDNTLTLSSARGMLRFAR
jgi:heat shock protein HslJ